MKKCKLKWWVKPLLIGTPIMVIAMMILAERVEQLIALGY